MEKAATPIRATYCMPHTKEGTVMAFFVYSVSVAHAAFVRNVDHNQWAAVLNPLRPPTSLTHADLRLRSSSLSAYVHCIFLLCRRL
jgi:hypothetical protein